MVTVKQETSTWPPQHSEIKGKTTRRDHDDDLKLPTDRLITYCRFKGLLGTWFPLSLAHQPAQLVW